MAKINFKPNEDRVLVQPAPAEEKTSSGIIIPDTAKEKPQKGKVIAVGDGLVQLFLQHFVVLDRVAANDAAAHFLVGQSLNLDRVQAGIFGDLFEGQGGVLNQPYCAGFWF